MGLEPGEDVPAAPNDRARSGLAGGEGLALGFAGEE